MNGQVSSDVVFEGVAAPFRVHDSDQVLKLLPQIVRAWPFEVREANPSARPFFSVRSTADPVRFLSETHVQDKPARALDPVNALCDMVATLPYALADTDDKLICLHAAGVELGGRLVVFPNIRRAGKSTLCCALAKSGHRVFGDDVLPTSFDEDGHAYGQAMGIAPRLRMPLPETLAPEFRTWVGKTPGPENKQYKYLALSSQPAKGNLLRIGGFVVLDRQDDPCAARLTPVNADEAMSALLHQNFTRDRHSADILTSIASVLSSEPCHRLSYFDLEDAVSCLQKAFDDSPIGTDAPPAGDFRRFRLADFSRRVPRKLRSDGVLRRRDGSHEQLIGDTLYLSDPEGRAIRRMDPLAAAIWAVLEDPATAQELEHLLVEAFPGVPPEQIANDLDKLLRRLCKAGLIVSDRASG